MSVFYRKEHWENIYSTKKFTEVSWYQKVPETSLKLIDELKLPDNSNIIDIGGGDSFLVDNLLEKGYENISVLDVSAKAIDRAKSRLGDKSEKVNWIESDASNFNPEGKFDLWHDRAAFHFLTSDEEVNNYVNTVKNSINKNGYLIIGSFSENGPTKCSGINIRQYSEEKFTNLFEHSFSKVKCFYVDHQTPSGSIQNFVFCVFKKV